MNSHTAGQKCPQPQSSMGKKNTTCVWDEWTPDQVYFAHSLQLYCKMFVQCVSVGSINQLMVLTCICVAEAWSWSGAGKFSITTEVTTKDGRIDLNMDRISTNVGITIGSILEIDILWTFLYLQQITQIYSQSLCECRFSPCPYVQCPVSE